MMNYRDISILAIKLTGIALIAIALIRIPNLFPYLSADADIPWWVQLIAIILPYLLPVLIGILFFMFPATLTNKFIKGGESSDGRSDTFVALEYVALRVLGVFFMFYVISDITYHTIYAIAVSRVARDGTSAFLLQDPNWYANMLSTLVELVVALWLILGTKGIMQMLVKMRGRA